jgi:formate-dependent nitrite reductase cytochrome c552 subunit
MVMDNSFSKMVKHIKGSIKTIKNTVMEYLIGMDLQAKDAMKAGGLKENKMDMELLLKSRLRIKTTKSG